MEAIDLELGENEPYSDREAPTYNVNDINPRQFVNHLWPLGVPLVLRGVKKKGNWGPEYWIERYGDQKVTLENCETGETKTATVEEYLSTYGAITPRTEAWKLKVRWVIALLFNNRLTCYYY